MLDTLSAPAPNLPTPPLSPSPRRARLWWLAVVLIFFTVSNFLILPTLLQLNFFGPPTPLAVIGLAVEVGGVIAQFLILSFLAPLGPGSTLLRQGMVWLAAAALVGSFATGVGIVIRWQADSSAPENFVFLFIPLFAIPAVFATCQAPLWALRYFLRWRTAASDGIAQDSGQISIGGMFVATAVVAVALGLCRLGLSMEHAQWGEGQYGQGLSPLAWWGGIGLAAAIAWTISAAVLPVTSMLILRSKSWMVGATTAFAYLSGCVLSVHLVARVWSGVWPDGEAIALLATFYFSIAVSLLLSLLIIRSAGYRLWWGREAATIPLEKEAAKN